MGGEVDAEPGDRSLPVPGGRRDSKASWPFTVRAAQAANRLCLPASGNALSAAKASPSSSMVSQSNGS